MSIRGGIKNLVGAGRSISGSSGGARHLLDNTHYVGACNPRLQQGMQGALKKFKAGGGTAWSSPDVPDGRAADGHEGGVCVGRHGLPPDRRRIFSAIAAAGGGYGGSLRSSTVPIRCGGTACSAVPIRCCGGLGVGVGAGGVGGGGGGGTGR